MSADRPTASDRTTSPAVAGGARWRWRGLSVGVLLVLGVALFSARGALAPLLGVKPAVVPAELSLVAAIEPPPAAEPVRPKPLLSLEQLNEVLESVPPQLQALIEAGQEELPAFEGLDSDQPVRQRQMWNRFHAWGPIWRNRLVLIERQLPAAAAWRPHADLDSPYRALREIFVELGKVPDVGSVAAAEDLLAAASELLAALMPEVDEQAPDEDPPPGSAAQS